MQQQNDRGILKKEIRSYEVSLWTLQDEFITVLKWSDAEQKGRIEQPKLTINVDGTQKFSCNIPMYYRTYNNENSNLNGKLIENPNWYTVKNGQLIMGLRKLKVIFNKGEEYLLDIMDEERMRIRSSNTFELLITKVTESHENDQLICSIECEGLAFHELGKIGYKIDLSEDNFIRDNSNWKDTGSWKKRDNTISNEEPVENLDYWCEQCDLIKKPNNLSEIKYNTWYYDVQMNWGSFEDQARRIS